MSPSRRQPAPPGTPHRRAHCPCGLAVGRDVPIAPHRPVAVRPTRVPSPCPVVRSRDHAQPIEPSTRALPGRHGAWLGIPPPRRAPWCGPIMRSITPAHYSGGAMGTSRPTAITPAKFARNTPPRPVVVRPLRSHTLPPPKKLCVPIHPARTLFVFLCVKTTHCARDGSTPPTRPWGLPTARDSSPQNRCCKTNYFLLHYHR